MCALVEEKVLHHLRRLSGSGQTWPGVGGVCHQEEEEKEQEQEEEKRCFHRGEFKSLVHISRGTRYVENNLIFFAIVSLQSVKCDYLFHDLNKL